MGCQSKLVRIVATVMSIVVMSACSRGSQDSTDTQVASSSAANTSASSSTDSGVSVATSSDGTASTGATTDGGSSADGSTDDSSEQTGDTADTEPAPDDAVPCSIDNLELLPSEPVCYHIRVPEDWESPDSGEQIILQVAVFTEPDLAGSADPLVYFDGGPGVKTLDGLLYSYDSLVKPFVDQRDVIVFDQRGVGTSNPNLDCPEVIDFELAVGEGEVGADEVETGANEAVDSCRDRLEAEGIDLAAYNTESSAHDADAIRAGLGYDTWNVLATSYGTRLAQTYMRLYPDSLRSVVLDSVLPVEADPIAEMPAAMQRSLVLVINACTEDPDCSSTYPNFGDDLVTLAQGFVEAPPTVEVKSLDGDEYEFVVTDRVFGRLLASALYDKALFASLPQLVADGLEQDYGLLGSLIQVGLVQNDLFSPGVQYSVMCHDEVPFASEDQYNLNLPDKVDTQLLLGGANESNPFDVCRDWPSGEAPPIEDKAVISEVPTLVLSGTFDPVTPPSFAEMVADHLPNSYLFEFPTESHGLIRNSCGRQMAATFIADPTDEPDATCIDELPGPRWVLGEAADEVAMVPFETSSPVALSGVRPQGWTPVGPGAFARQESLADPATLIVQATGGLSEQALIKQLDQVVKATLKPLDDTKVGSESWKTYSALSDSAASSGETEVLVMLSPVDDVFVVLISPPDQFDQLIKTVAIPFATGLEVS